MMSMRVSPLGPWGPHTSVAELCVYEGEWGHTCPVLPVDTCRGPQHRLGGTPSLAVAPTRHQGPGV